MSRFPRFFILVCLLVSVSFSAGLPVAAQAAPADLPSSDEIPPASDATPVLPAEPTPPARQAWVEPSTLLAFSAPRPAGPPMPGEPVALAPQSPGRSPSPASVGDWDNGWALGCILPLGIAHNAAFGAGLATAPPFDFFPAVAEYAANWGLKFCAPWLLPPPEFQRVYTEVVGAICGSTFIQERTDGEYKNFFGFTLPWGDVYPGKDWGDFNDPAVIHWNTDVEIALTSNSWTDQGNDQYWLPLGVHNLTWRGDTTASIIDFIPKYIPGAAWTKLNKLFKLKGLAEESAETGLEVGLDLVGGELADALGLTFRTGMFNEEIQRVAVIDPTLPVLTRQVAGVIPIEAIQPGGISRSTYHYLLERTLSASDNCDPNPEIITTNLTSLPDFAPLGSSYTVHWVAQDRGPTSLSGGTNTSLTVSTTFVVQDTLPPVILAPPSIVLESASLPAAVELGYPATFDLADLDPTISHNACTRPNVVCEAGGVTRFPAGQTTVTWSAVDDAGNTSTATQRVNIKSTGANRAPTAASQTGANQVGAVAYEPITITLTAQDPDQDPLWFSLNQQPQNGFFRSPLYPYFIQDYRLANVQNISFLQYCADPAHRSQYIPTNWPVEAQFMAVADEGTVYVHDNGMVFCNNNGDVSTSYRLAIFRPDGTWEQVASSFDVKDIHIDWRQGYIYTTRHDTSSSYNLLQRYNLDLSLVDEFRLDYADVEMNSPKQGLMDDQGLIFVSNGFQYSGAAQLYVYDTTLGSDPVLVGDYTIPGRVFMDLALDSQGNLYASERDADRVYKFSPALRSPNGSVTPGVLLGWLGKCDAGPGCDIASGRSFGYSCTDSTCTLNPGSTTYGSLPGQLDFPRGIAMDPSDILYVTDYNNLRVQRFTPEGYYAGQAISECDGSCFVLGDFGRPRQVTVNSSHFYVLDDNTDLLHVFETTPLTQVDDRTAQIVYQSDNNFVGVDSFTFSVTDGLATSAPAVVQINTARNYRPPVAKPVPPVSIAEDTPVLLPLSGYDPDESLDTLSFVTSGAVPDGTLSQAPTGLVFTPAADFTGTASFSIQAFDGLLLSDPQPVSVTVTPVNDEVSFPAAEDGVPQGIAFRTAGEFIDLARFAPLDAQDEPLAIGRGYNTVFAVTFYDPDDLDRHLLEVDWGDGSPVEPEGELLEDGTKTGPLLTKGDARGYGTVTAEHIFSQNGSYTVQVCLTDNVQVDAGGNKTPTAASTTACKAIPVVISAMADLLLDIQPSHNPVALGQPLTYAVTLTNNPPENGAGVSASGVTLTDRVDARQVVQSYTISKGACTRTGQDITCTVGSLAPGESVTLEISALPAPGLVAGKTLMNQANYATSTPNQATTLSSQELVPVVHPGSFIVDMITDGPDADPADGLCATADGKCTLRAAIQQANALPGPQTISLPGWQVMLTSDLVISSDVTLRGVGASRTVLAGSGSHRILTISGSPVVKIAGLTLQGGYEASLDGGALYVSGGSVELDGVQISGSHSGGRGGAVYNAGTLVVKNSSLSGNDSQGGAGGIENTASLALHNVTLTGNQGQQGGIASSGSAALVHVTLTGNHALASGGGLSGGAANFNLQNTILWGNTAASGGPECSSGFTSLDHNLLGSLAGCTVAAQAASDLVGQDPRLASLALSNVAGTLSNALTGGSPAIDRGVCVLPADQHGSPRPVDGNLDGTASCDIGAFEFEPLGIFLPIMRK